MRSTRGAFYALAVLGGYFIWRNRFAIQQQLESFGVKTPLFSGDLAEKARSAVSKISGKVEHGINQAKDEMRDMKDSDITDQGLNRSEPKVMNY
ncbi:MAG: hypothetical protein AB1540_12845 [Bdellovibrionota bacterium]